MLVIEGYVGKSLEVEKYIGTLENQDVLIIAKDKLVLNSMLSQNKNRVYFTEQSNVKDIEDIIGLNSKFKHVIFYQNVKKEDISTYKNIEHIFDLQAVLTVQTHDRENPIGIKKYNV